MFAFFYEESFRRRDINDYTYLLTSNCLYVSVCKADDNQKKADRLYELKMKELDQRACELQHAEEDCRRAIVSATKNYNLAQVSFVSLYFTFIFSRTLQLHCKFRYCRKMLSSIIYRDASVL